MSGPQDLLHAHPQCTEFYKLCMTTHGGRLGLYVT